MLTAGVDTGKDFVGTNKNDVFNAIDNVNGNPTWTIADSIDGGAGIDTFNVMTDDNVTTPFSASVKNVENMDVTANGKVELNTTDFTGLTTLNTTGKDDATITAAATTDVNVTSTDAGTAGVHKIAVNGGKNVTVVSKNNIGDDITVGATTAAAEKVSVTSTGAAPAAGTTQGAIAVTGGTEITVNQYAGNAAGAGTANIGGTVTVTGNASTTTVTVNQTATAAATATVVGYTAGDVNVNDVNRADNTKAGTIETVTIKNAGIVAVDSSALKTLNLEGAITSVNANSAGKATVDTLALNLKGVTVAAANNVTVDADVKTLNVNSSTTVSTLNNLVAAGATTVNVSGDAALTLTNNTFTAATAINVTNTVGASFGTAIGVNTTFTGGAGNDTIILAGAQTKAITMGAGDDKVTYAGALATGGSVAAGDGNDTIVMNVTQANIAGGASSSSVFNNTFTGFETLELSDGIAGTIDLNGINGVSTVILDAGVAGALTLNNLVSKGTVKLNASTAVAGALTIGVKDSLLPNTDVLNLELSSTGILNAGSITAANVETININVADAVTLGSAAVTHTANLTLADATSIVVAGNNGLNLTNNTLNTKVTNFDASGVVANGTADTAANLAVTFTSRNATTTANVTIIGGAGNDELTGNAAKDTINGGEGNDTITGGAGADILTGGAGADMFKFTLATDSNGVNADTITDFVSGTDKLGITNNTAMTYAGEVSGYGTALTTLDKTGAKAIAVLDTATSTLYVDLDADGALTDADLAIKLTVNDLSQTDFVTFGTTGAITGSAFADTIYAATTGNAITAGAGDDTITLSATSAIDTIIFAGTAAANGVDTITGFEFGAGKDVLNFNALITAKDVAGGAAAVTSTLSGISIADSLDFSVNTANVIVLDDIQILTAANFGSAASATVVQTAASSNYVVFGDVAADADAIQNIYYVTTDASNVATVTLVGTINEGLVDTGNIA